MIKYVSTLIFSADRQHVVLVEKKRGPDFLRGKWTAIGGHVEDGESLVDAAKRELLEEADVKMEDIVNGTLVQVALIERQDECVIFAGVFEDEEYERFNALTDERVEFWLVEDILAGREKMNVTDDTGVLIAMAFYALDGGNLFFNANEKHAWKRGPGER